MERSDRILFTIATVIIVIMLAGAGSLVYERWQVMNAPPAAVVSDTPSLTPPETTQAATPATTPAAAPVSKPKIPKQPHGSDFGFVTRVRASGSTVYVTYDPAELLIGDAARLRESQKGNPLYYSAQYAIANDTHKLKTYPLTKKAIVDIIGPDGKTKTVSPADFTAAFAKDPSLHDTTWWVWATGGSMTHIAQVAFPPAP